MKTHTGEQKNVCPNEGCDRKLSSGRSLTEHLKIMWQREKCILSKKGMQENVCGQGRFTET